MMLKDFESILLSIIAIFTFLSGVIVYIKDFRKKSKMEFRLHKIKYSQKSFDTLTSIVFSLIKFKSELKDDSISNSKVIARLIKFMSTIKFTETNTDIYNKALEITMFLSNINIDEINKLHNSGKMKIQLGELLEDYVSILKLDINKQIDIMETKLKKIPFLSQIFTKLNTGDDFV